MTPDESPVRSDAPAFMQHFGKKTCLTTKLYGYFKHLTVLIHKCFSNFMLHANPQQFHII